MIIVNVLLVLDGGCLDVQCVRKINIMRGNRDSTIFATMTTISISLLTFKWVRLENIFAEPFKMISLLVMLFAILSVKVDAFEFFEENNDSQDSNIFDTRKVCNAMQCTQCNVWVSVTIKFTFSRQLNLTAASGASLLFAPLALLLVSGIS